MVEGDVSFNDHAPVCTCSVDLVIEEPGSLKPRLKGRSVSRPVSHSQLIGSVVGRGVLGTTTVAVSATSAARAMIEAVPAPLATTFPRPSTVATEVFVLVQ